MGQGLLTAEDIARYHRDGFLLRTGLLPEPAISELAAAAARLVTTERPERILESNGEAVRSVYGPHLTDDVVGRLARRPELAQAASQLIGTDELYIHQSKVNVKAPFAGEAWDWHQDYIYWLLDDGIRLPRLVNVAVFIDDATEFNGPLIFVPGSHQKGVLAADEAAGMPVGYEQAPAWVATLTSREKYAVRREVIADLVERAGLASAKGERGCVLFFHPNILHASAPNMSPFGRSTLILVYNAVDNPPTNTASPRPEFLAARVITPLAVGE